MECICVCWNWLCESVNSLDMQICVCASQHSLMLCTLQTQSCHTRRSVSPQCISSLLLSVSQSNFHLLTLLLTDWQIFPEDRSKRWDVEKPAERKRRGRYECCSVHRPEGDDLSLQAFNLGLVDRFHLILTNTNIFTTDYKIQLIHGWNTICKLYVWTNIYVFSFVF